MDNSNVALQGDEGTDSSLRGAKGIIRHCEEGEARRGNPIHQCKIASLRSQ